MMVQKHSLEAVLPSFHVFPAWQYAYVSTILCHHAGHQQAAAPSQPHHCEGKQLMHLHLFCAQITILFFTFCTVLKKLPEIFNTLLYSRLCVRWFCLTLSKCKCSEHL